jgi:hypothetical protein
VCVVTTAGRPVPAPSRAVGLGGLARPALAMVSHSRSLSHAAPRWLTLPLSSFSTHAGVSLASCPCRGQPTGLPVHVTPLASCSSGRTLPLCARRPAAVSEVTRPLTSLFLPCRHGRRPALVGCSLVEPPQPNVLCTCPHPVPCCLPPSSNFGVCSAPGLLGRARPRSPITCEPCFLSPIEGTLSFAFAYPSPCAPPRRPFCHLVIIGMVVPPRCAAKPLGSHMASLLHRSLASSSAAAKTEVGHGCSSIS